MEIYPLFYGTLMAGPSFIPQIFAPAPGSHGNPGLRIWPFRSDKVP